MAVTSRYRQAQLASRRVSGPDLGEGLHRAPRFPLSATPPVPSLLAEASGAALVPMTVFTLLFQLLAGLTEDEPACEGDRLLRSPRNRTAQGVMCSWERLRALSKAGGGGEQSVRRTDGPSAGGQHRHGA